MIILLEWGGAADGRIREVFKRDLKRVLDIGAIDFGRPIEPLNRIKKAHRMFDSIQEGSESVRWGD